MTKSQGILIDSFKSRHCRFIRSFVLQSILQCLTFGAAIVTYHNVAMPQLTLEARQDGWRNAVELTCPNKINEAGG